MSWVPLPWWTSQSTIATRSPLGQLPRRNGNVVEQAESHRLIELGMVTRRTTRGKCDIALSGLEGVHGVEQRSCRPARRVPRARCRIGVGVDVAAACLAEIADLCHESRVVGPFEFLDRCEPGFNHPHRLDEPCGRNSGKRRIESARAFRVTIRCMVLIELGGREHGDRLIHTPSVRSAARAAMLEW